MSARRERSVLSWLLIAFAVGCATMIGMKAINWLVPDPPTRIEIRAASERFA